jgi:hypothetical protein
LNVDECRVGVHLAGKHAPEFEPLDVLDQRRDVAKNVRERAFVALLRGQRVEVRGFRQRAIEPRELADDALERGALAAEPLRPLLIRPNVGIFELLVDLFETLTLLVVVKDTPSGPHTDP